MAELDYLIKDAEIVDGTGAAISRGSLGIKGERIEYLGAAEKCGAERIIEARGLLLTPGFIDIHDHSDGLLEEDHSWESMEAGNLLRQGVTTVIGGNCGFSPFPVGEHLSKVAASGFGVNYGLLVGHGRIREEFMEKRDVKAAAEDLEEMSNALRFALEEGAFGLSSGLSYLPGCFADTEELAALGAIVAEKGGIYASHIRSEENGVIGAVAEAIEIGRRAGVPVQISHLKCARPSVWGSGPRLLEMIDKARGEGLDVSCDQYPYLASYTGLADELLPAWAREGDGLAGRLKDRGMGKRIINDVERALESLGGGENVMLASSMRGVEHEGKRVSQAAQEMKMDEVSAVIKLIERDPDISAIYFCMCEEDVLEIMRHEATFIGTDGGAKVHKRGVVHPRNYGTYPRVLARYVREKKALEMREAVAKMTSRPAAKLGLKERGALRRGYYADLVLLDPRRIEDRATYEETHNYPDGIKFVFVNGHAVVEEGERKPDLLPGKVLRRGE